MAWPRIELREGGDIGDRMDYRDRRTAVTREVAALQFLELVPGGGECVAPRAVQRCRELGQPRPFGGQAEPFAKEVLGSESFHGEPGDTGAIQVLELLRKIAHGLKGG